MSELKKCSKCGKLKALEQFNKNITKSDGLQSECRSCGHEYQRKYRQEHKSNYIYFIYANGSKTPAYVGSCSHIDKRVSNHINLHSNLSDHMSEGWSKITYLEVDHLVNSYEERIFLEHTIIDMIEPIWNNRNYLPKIDDTRAEELTELAEDILYNIDELDVYKVNESFFEAYFDECNELY